MEELNIYYASVLAASLFVIGVAVGGIIRSMSKDRFNKRIK